MNGKFAEGLEVGDRLCGSLVPLVKMKAFRDHRSLGLIVCPKSGSDLVE